MILRTFILLAVLVSSTAHASGIFDMPTLFSVQAFGSFHKYPLYPAGPVPASVYPKETPVRHFGSNQADYGDCMAHADVNALEQAFANRGYAVRLSLFYRHAKIWANLPWQSDVTAGLSLDGSDLAVMAAAGSFIPEYMWPENMDDRSDFSTAAGQPPHAIRPGPAQQALIDPAFPTAESLGFSSAEFHVTVEGLKSAVNSGAAVVLRVHNEVLYLQDDKTGLMDEDYASERGKFIGSPTAHQVAVVGYDDALQAFIVRNSWNTPIAYTWDSELDRVTAGADFQKFRAKISPQNLTSYKLVPYAYVADLGNFFDSSFHVMGLNYDAYADAYFKFADKYRTAAVPYVCEQDSTTFQSTVKSAKSKIFQTLSEQVTKNWKVLEEAKLPATANDRSRLTKFFNGDYAKFYCPQGKQAPGREFNHLRTRDLKVDGLLMDLGRNDTSEIAWKHYLDRMSSWIAAGGN